MLTKLHYDAVLYQPFTNTSASYKCLNENNNFMIDDIDQWLESASGTIYTNIAPISLTTDIAVKLPINEVESVNTSKPTYMKIITRDYNNQIINKFYYFIRGVKRFANETLEYQAHIDVLNTFHDAIKNGLTSRTLVQREHRDRFKKRSSVGGILSCYKAIDDISEGLKPLKFVNTKNKIQTNISGLNDTNWYLIYKTASELTTADAANPVSCFCCSDKELSLATTAPASLTVRYTDLTAGTYYYFGYPDAWSFDSGLTHLDSTIYPKNFFIFYRSGDTISDELWGADGENWTLRSTRTNRTELVFTILPKCTFSTTYCDQLAIWQNYPISGFAAGDTYKIMKYDDTDNTDSKLVKIIQLPYAPVTMSYSAGLYSYDTTKWSWYNQLLKLNDIHNSFSNSEFNTISMPVLEDIDLTNTTRHIIDPKLLHSDFHTEKFSYDNFGLEFNLEEMEYDNTVITTTILTPVYNIDFYPTNTINSNFMFDIKVKDSADADGITYRTPQDYNVLVASRNNEVTVFNNAYINYLKTGYNYDKKAKAISSTSSWIGTAVGIGSTAAGIALSATGAGAGVGAALVVSGLATTISSLTSAISNDLSQENALQSKLTSLKAQATAVSGCDDIDLLNRYNGNKLWYITYNPNDQIQNMLDNLFYYYGYTTSYIKKPDLDSRTRFNFLQCTPDFTQDTYKLIGDFSIEVINKCKEGFTNIHHYESVWDTLQVYENYETSLYGTSPTPTLITYTVNGYLDTTTLVGTETTQAYTRPADIVMYKLIEDNFPTVTSSMRDTTNSHWENLVFQASYKTPTYPVAAQYKDANGATIKATATLGNFNSLTIPAAPTITNYNFTSVTFNGVAVNVGDVVTVSASSTLIYNYALIVVKYTLTIKQYRDNVLYNSYTQQIVKDTTVTPTDYFTEISGFDLTNVTPTSAFTMTANATISGYYEALATYYTLTIKQYRDGSLYSTSAQTIQAGQTVTPTDYFIEISGYDLTSVSPTSAFTMSSNATVSGYYEALVTYYTLTIEQYRDGSLYASSTETIQAGQTVNPTSYFNEISGYDLTSVSPSSSFTISSNTTIKGYYESTQPITYTLTIKSYHDGTLYNTSTEYISSGTTITPTTYFGGVSGYDLTSVDPSSSFPMTSNTTISGYYELTNYIYSVDIYGSTNGISGNYVKLTSLQFESESYLTNVSSLWQYIEDNNIYDLSTYNINTAMGTSVPDGNSAIYGYNNDNNVTVNGYLEQHETYNEVLLIVYNDTGKTIYSVNATMEEQDTGVIHSGNIGSISANSNYTIISFQYQDTAWQGDYTVSYVVGETTYTKSNQIQI